MYLQEVVYFCLPLLLTIATIILSFILIRKLFHNNNNSIEATVDSSSSSSSTPKWVYDVFLSFRGEDTRTNFVDHLHTALTDRGIITFKDDLTLERGKSVAPELLQAIQHSRFAIVVFSNKYAHSSWCLDELVKIVHCKNSIGQTVLPVFFDVDPSHVRKQTGCFGEAFSKHEINGRKDEIQLQNWRSALAEAASISGWVLSNTANGHQAQCIKQIVGNILTVLGNVTSSNYASSLIGMEYRVRSVKSLLLKGAEDEVHMVGIWGMGGAGKTTLARAVFNDISNQFECRSFVANVREVSKSSSGVHSLQEKVLSEFLMEKNLKISDVDAGIIMMSRLCNKKVFLVLDDVDDVNQLEALVGKRNWFGEGSRIVITTRDEHLLRVHGVNEIQRVVLLDNDESLLLFQKHAFNNTPQEDYANLAMVVVNKVGGHPLALKVLGLSLYSRSIVEWEDAVKKLMKHEPNKQVLGILKISYDGLERNEQEIFLDIACFFLEEKKDDVLEILDSFDLNPNLGLSVLIEKCLVDVIHDGTLQMHDMMKELAWDIVDQMGPTEPAKRSRLWRYEDVHAVLQSDTETESIKGIKFFQRDLGYNFNGFKNMKKLRLLHVSYNDRGRGTFYGPGPEYLSDELSLIRWRGYPSRSLPPCFRANKLVYLHMNHSRIVQLWKGRKILDMLKVVDLSFSDYLTKTPDFSAAPNLEKLILYYCRNLKEVHPSLGNLQRLTFLDLSFCSNLKRFSFGFNMTSLEFLKLNACEKLKVFPQIVGDMKRLKELHLDQTAIKEVHPSIEKLTGLVVLNLNSCRNLRSLPSTIGHLKRLKTLDLSRCPSLEELPKNLQEMECLKKLYLQWTPIKQPPSSILQLKNLKTLSIGDCNNLKTYSLTSAFSSSGKSLNHPMDFFAWENISGLSSLKKLIVVDDNRSEIPSTIGLFINLELLSLRGNSLKCLPDNLCQLSRLKELNLEGCKKLETLPKLPSGIAKLVMDGCESLDSLGDLLTTNHEWLYTVSLKKCIKLMKNEPRSDSGGYDVAEILIPMTLQGLSIVKQHEFSIVVPRKEIPDWISTKLEEDMADPSLQLMLLPNWDRNIGGFAMSFHMSFFLNSLTVSLGDKYIQRLRHRLWYTQRLGHSSWMSSFDWMEDHVWVGYISLDYLGKLLFGDTYKSGDDWVGGNEASFLRVQFHGTYPRNSKGNFGIRVVYKEDVKHIYNDDTEHDLKSLPRNPEEDYGGFFVW